MSEQDETPPPDWDDATWRRVFQASYFESYVGGESRRKVRWAAIMVLIVVGALVLSMVIGLISDDTGPPPTTFPTLQFPTLPLDAPPDD